MNSSKRTLRALLALWVVGCCCVTTIFANNTKTPDTSTPFLGHYQRFLVADSNDVLVISHRGNWRNAPENSLPAIQKCIDMGIAMVEVDVRKTSDGHLVLMHDGTVNRTTNGRGKVSEMTLEQIKALRLKDANGQLTDEQVPTLEEAMRLAHGKIMMNLDKAYSLMADCLKVLEKTDTVDQALFKGSGNAEKIKNDLAKLGTKVNFMLIVNIKDATSPSVESVMKSIEILRPSAVELIFKNDANPVLLPENLAKIRKMGTRVWVNTMWDSLCGGHIDRGPDKTPDGWDWCVQRGVNMIQTDRPKQLKKYFTHQDS